MWRVLNELKYFLRVLDADELRDLIERGCVAVPSAASPKTEILSEADRAAAIVSLDQFRLRQIIEFQSDETAEGRRSLDQHTFIRHDRIL